MSIRRTVAWYSRGNEVYSCSLVHIHIFLRTVLKLWTDSNDLFSFMKVFFLLKGLIVGAGVHRNFRLSIVLNSSQFGRSRYCTGRHVMRRPTWQFPLVANGLVLITTIQWIHVVSQNHLEVSCSLANERFSIVHP